MTPPDSGTLPDPVLQQQVKAAEPEFLDLLLPQDLPTTLTLGPAEQVQMHVVLSGILHALKLSDADLRLRQLTAILRDLPAPDQSDTGVGDTGIPAKSDQVEDFDRYFHVSRVTSTAPAVPMVRGLLQTCLAVLTLCQRTDALAMDHIAQQLEGFRAYTHLLARCFGLAELT